MSEVPQDVQDEFNEKLAEATDRIGEAISGTPIIVVISACLNTVISAAEQIPEVDVRIGLAQSLQQMSEKIAESVKGAGRPVTVIKH